MVAIHAAVARMNVRLDSTRMRTLAGNGIAAISSNGLEHGDGGHTACFCRVRGWVEQPTGALNENSFGNLRAAADVQRDHRRARRADGHDPRHREGPARRSEE